MKKYLAIFDLDGTLFDTRYVNYCSYKEALKEYGINLDKEFFYKKCFGRSYKEFLPELMENDSYIDDVHKAKMEIYNRNLDKARINHHLFNMIKLIKNEYYLAIVTTASKKNLLNILQFFECQDLFDYFLTQDDLIKNKPDPEGFLKAMKHFSVDKEHTVIFEDSDIGVEAAEAAGASVLIVDKF